MSRIFARGELKAAIVHVLAEAGPSNGYAIMSNLAERIGGGWKPSPGAIYPALLTLEDTGLITGRIDGESKTYELTPGGHRALDAAPGLLDAVAARASTRPVERSVGPMLDHFAAGFPHRGARLTAPQADAVAQALADATTTIEHLIDTRST